MIENTAQRFSNYNRLRKFNFFMEHFKPSDKTLILDVGASEDEHQENANIIEKRYPYPENITALGIDRFEKFRARYPKVKTVVYGGGYFPLEDRSFDICWSNAVIEHVEPGEARERFIKEIKRVAKAAFITTPNRYFPMEVHTRLFFVHWLPKKIFDRILMICGKKGASGDYMYLMSKRDIKCLLKRCGISEYKIIENRFFGLTVDFVIIF